MLHFSALNSIVFMMAFVLLFDRMHWRHKHVWGYWSRNLLSQGDSERLLKIAMASYEG